MKIYTSSMYGRGAIFVTPGKDHPEVVDWTKPVLDEGGRVVRKPFMITVKFENGCAEVDEKLAKYMLANKLASASPQPVPVPRAETGLDDGRPKYSTPIAVGRPLFPDGGMPPDAPPLIGKRLRRNVKNAAAAVARRI